MNFNDFYLVFEDKACQVFEEYRQTGTRKEYGGILLGKVRKNSILITIATRPTKWDKSSKYNFTRHRKSAQKFTNIAFYRSGGTVIYLGEWHTHPENHPTPSNVDRNMIVEQFHQNIINEQFLLMVVIGIESNFYAVYDGKDIIPIKPEKIHLIDFF